MEYKSLNSNITLTLTVNSTEYIQKLDKLKELLQEIAALQEELNRTEIEISLT